MAGTLQRLNYLLMRRVLPFNFGMTVERWQEFFDRSPGMRALVGDDPQSWSPESRAEVDERAARENALYDRLMALADEEFYREVDRIAGEE